MKKLILLFAFTASLLLACNDTGNNEKDENNSINTLESNEATETQETDIEQPENSLFENKLTEILKNKNLVFEQLKGLKKAIASQDEMKSVDEVEKALKMRDSLIYLLNNDEGFYTYMERDDADRFYEDFEKLGIQVVEAEGMFGALDQQSIFEEVIEKVADEPYILKNKILNLNASSHGSEYPYFDITEEMEIAPLAEKMITKYPGHKYNKEIVEMLHYALFPLTDFHKAPDDFANYIVGSYDLSAYPGATDISNHQTFIKKHSKSRFAKVVEKILENPSAISAREFEKLYFVEVPDLKLDSVFADEKLNNELKNLPEDLRTVDDSFKYLWLGLDVPHTLTLMDGDGNQQVLVYRFFDKKEPAEKAFEVIKEVIPKAKLVEYTLTEADKKYSN